MAKILYGVAGQGAGHAARAKVIIEHLIKEGHEVKIVSHDQGYDILKNYHLKVSRVFGFRFAYKNNQIKYIPTLFKNVLKTKEAVKSLNKVNRIFDRFKPQIVFTDFEPISAIVANIKRVPLISIDNQHVLIRTKIKYPSRYNQDALAAKVITELMILQANAYLVTNFSKDKVIKKNTYLFNPILRKEVFKLKPTSGDYVFVYVTSRFNKNLLRILKKVDKKFIIYGFDKDRQVGNLTFKKAWGSEFLKDLAGCEAIIGNAGFVLMGEALYLKKPYLAIPVKRQFEQVLNAYTAERLGYGKYWDEIDKEKIESFFGKLDVYKKNLKKYKRKNNTMILRKIDDLIKKYT